MFLYENGLNFEMGIMATFCENSLTITFQISPTVSLFIFRWRCFYYLSIFLYGVWVLWTKPWLWDIKYCWYNYPHHKIERDVWYVFIFMQLHLCFYELQNLLSYKHALPFSVWRAIYLNDLFFFLVKSNFYLISF